VLIKEPLKSYVLRKGRITSNQRRAIEDLWDEFVLDSNKDLSDSYAKEAIALDIGFGAGETTSHLAKAKPEMTILGAEVYLSGIGSLLSKISEDRLENIKILNSDIVPFLENNVQECSFDLVLMFYPDPWPKRKHHKRRLLQKNFLELLHRKIKKGGIFYFKTDWDHYFQEVNKIFLDEDKWQVIKKSDLEAYLIALPETSFELKALASDRKLNELILKRIN